MAKTQNNINFKDGFAEGFLIPIPERFSSAFAEKSLSKGDVLFPSVRAYGDVPWNEVLKHNEWFLQIKETMTGGETVLFDLYSRNQDGTAFLPSSVHKLAWDDFIRRLRSGNFSGIETIRPDRNRASSGKNYDLKRPFLDDFGQPPSSINLKYRAGRGMDELIGICKGVIADGVCIEKEANYLQEWLCRNAEIAAIWPARELACRLARILWDGVVTPEEGEDLKSFLEEATGETDRGREVIKMVGGRANPATTLPLDSPLPQIQFPEREFCFTGRFLSGTRKWCFSQVEQRGGIASNSASRCHYLVIGEIGSRDWAHTSHGRKIEAAMERKAKETHWPKIVSEEHWSKHLGTGKRG
jgi:hypothetical protein